MFLFLPMERAAKLGDYEIVPKNVKDNLITRYDMIVTEKECVAELTDELRTCDTCNEWCPRFVFFPLILAAF